MARQTGDECKSQSFHLQVTKYTFCPKSFQHFFLTIILPKVISTLVSLKTLQQFLIHDIYDVTKDDSVFCSLWPFAIVHISVPLNNL